MSPLIMQHSKAYIGMIGSTQIQNSDHRQKSILQTALYPFTSQILTNIASTVHRNDRIINELIFQYVFLHFAADAAPPPTLIYSIIDSINTTRLVSDANNVTQNEDAIKSK